MILKPPQRICQPAAEATKALVGQTQPWVQNPPPRFSSKIVINVSSGKTAISALIQILS